MKLNKIKNSILLTILFILILISGCQSKNVKFSFSGRKVLYSDQFQGNRVLILLNLDTKEELLFDDFDEVERSDFILYNDGKNIFVDSYNATGKVFIYGVVKKSETEIDYQSYGIANFNNVKIFNNNFYFASQKNINSYSLSDLKLIREYNADSLIAQFEVYNEDLFAVNYSIYDDEHNGIRPSSIYIKDFKNKSSKEIPYLALLYDLSLDKQKLLFNSRGPKIMYYPSLVVHPIDAIEKDSLEIYSWMRFVGKDELIFAGFKKGKDPYESTNLYLLHLVTNKIERITNSKTVKEIKSTIY
ncbi:MAG TPA: hypothetical protein VLH59_13850 [Ignavibacteriaceae bacterium]|nr:hypothetical protein [Ignavibacteriaceae bacterium]